MVDPEQQRSDRDRDARQREIGASGRDHDRGKHEGGDQFDDRRDGDRAFDALGVSAGRARCQSGGGADPLDEYHERSGAERDRIAVPSAPPIARPPRTSQNAAKHPWMMPPTRKTRRVQAWRAESVALEIAVDIGSILCRRAVPIPGDGLGERVVHRRRREAEGRLRGCGVDDERIIELVADLGDLANVGNEHCQRGERERRDRAHLHPFPVAASLSSSMT